ncbi:MGH1-like glycoside hydrolase domain-containing protein [Candidatus Neptunichlamydia sp. REUL1]|uniref:MGH1-like glycoside hydrolase domain-containing protein n=1 Tax=Candidatus Neptunichlamydia sp. REUL1 TaxID=3064277 RepID=UPI0029316BF4|nr:glucosidase [Candidatus Neptunochlamydia sp. REUL1]
MSNGNKFIEFNEEELRLLQKGGDVEPWQKWGPYVTERAWGTVREDYSKDGNAWDHFTYEMAPYRAYRWGEDGIAGICDRYQTLAMTQAFWNGKDPILKERLYGLGTHKANHGEDVKEYYYYLDSLPSHAYMRYLYKYPCAEFPYEELAKENQSRHIEDREFELVDTGIFKDNRYFDITIEYAKAGKDDICVKIEIQNRSAKEESIHVIPQLIFRNTWGWSDEKLPEPILKRSDHEPINAHCIEADDSMTAPPARLSFDYHLGKRYFYADERAEVLFTDNETNREHLYNEKNIRPYTKDAFHRYIILEEKDKVNPKQKGTKACFYFRDLKIPAGGSKSLYLRLSNMEYTHPLTGVEEIIHKRKAQADEYYERIHPEGISDEEKLIQRQALAGMLWSKQIYLYDVNLWLRGDDPESPPPDSRKNIRNIHWKHLISKRILSMPDKWEYPWFAAWDLAFHCISFALVDMDFAKEQLWFLLFDQFQHPNGQVPAYEWEFSDLNPPVQGWAALRLFHMEEEKTGKRDIDFLKKCFHKLLLNFVWWVNKVDAKGNNVFEGGFLGMDNITVIDRSQAIPGGGKLEQSDGTGWMGFFCLNLMRMALELSKKDSVYEGMAVKFYEHFVYISNALVNAENREVQNWDEKDGFFYDVLSGCDTNDHVRIKVRSMVGLVPLYAVDCITSKDLEDFKEFAESFKWFSKNRTDLCKHCVTPIEEEGKTKYVLTLMEMDKVKRVLEKAWDPKEFRSEYGLRSLSKFHEENPYELLGNRIKYEPAEAESILMGGNSNWRGPLWFPTSFLFIEALKNLHMHTGNLIKIDGKNPHEMASYFAHAMINLFKKGADGKRPIYGDYDLFQTDPHFQDLILFYEHFHGDTGRGLGASHQTGWTGLVANLIDEWCRR